MGDVLSRCLSQFQKQTSRKKKGGAGPLLFSYGWRVREAAYENSKSKVQKKKEGKIRHFVEAKEKQCCKIKMSPLFWLPVGGRQGSS